MCVCGVISIYFLQYLCAGKVQWAGALLIFIVGRGDVMKDKHRQTRLKHLCGWSVCTLQSGTNLP